MKALFCLLNVAGCLAAGAVRWPLLALTLTLVCYMWQEACNQEALQSQQQLLPHQPHPAQARSASHTSPVALLSRVCCRQEPCPSALRRTAATVAAMMTATQWSRARFGGSRMRQARCTLSSTRMEHADAASARACARVAGGASLRRARCHRPRYVDSTGQGCCARRSR